MLLENFLNSGLSESMTDTQSAQKITISDSDILAVSNADDFKSALSSSLESGYKYQINQTDREHYESNLLIKSKADKRAAEVCMTAEYATVGDAKQADPVAVNIQLNSSDSSLNESKSKEPQMQGGDKMPTDGKPLPELLTTWNKPLSQTTNAELSNNKTTNQHMDTGAKPDIFTKPMNNAHVLSNEKTIETKTFDSKAIEAKSSEVKISESKSIDSKAIEVKSSEVKISETKSIDLKSIEAKSIEAKISESKTIDSKSIDSKSIEAKISESKTIDSKSIDSKSIEAKISESKTIDSKPVETKTSELRQSINNLIKKENEKPANAANVKSEQSKFTDLQQSTQNKLQETTQKEQLSKMVTMSVPEKSSFEPSVKPLINPYVDAEVTKKHQSINSTRNSGEGLVGTNVKSDLLSENNQKLKIKSAELVSGKELELTARNPVTKDVTSESTHNAIDKTIQSRQTVIKNSEVIKSEPAQTLVDKNQLLNRKVGYIPDQQLQQTAREDSASKVTTNTESLNQTSSRPVTSLTGEASVGQVNQLNVNQLSARHTDMPLSVSVPLQQWNQKFAERVSMLIFKGTTNAQIRLDPPELGPMAIRIQHSGAETHVQFQVNNPIARELVDSGMNRLREMLEQHGFDNIDVDVREHGQKEHQSTEDMIFADNNEQTDVITKDSSTIAEKMKNNSLLDVFA